MSSGSLPLSVPFPHIVCLNNNNVQPPPPPNTNTTPSVCFVYFFRAFLCRLFVDCLSMSLFVTSACPSALLQLWHGRLGACGSSVHEWRYLCCVMAIFFCHVMVTLLLLNQAGGCLLFYVLYTGFMQKLLYTLNKFLKITHLCFLHRSCICSFTCETWNRISRLWRLAVRSLNELLHL